MLNTIKFLILNLKILQYLKDFFCKFIRFQETNLFFKKALFTSKINYSLHNQSKIYLIFL